MSSGRFWNRLENMTEKEFTAYLTEPPTKRKERKVKQIRFLTEAETLTVDKQARREKKVFPLNDMGVYYEYADNFTVAVLANQAGEWTIGIAKRMPTDVTIVARGQEIALARAARNFAVEYGN